MARAVALGASDYLFKSCGRRQLLDAIKPAASGKGPDETSPFVPIAELMGRREKPSHPETPQKEGAAMQRRATTCLILLLVLLPGCGKREEKTRPTAQETQDSRTIAETPQTAPKQPAAGQSEDYVEVDPSELAFSIRDFYCDGVVSSEGTKPIGGEVGEVTCEGKALELVSKQFDDGFIVTKEYGKIKVCFSSSLSGESFSVWLTPPQREALLSLKHEPSQASVKPAAFDISPGRYEGSADEVVSFAVTIVSENGHAKVKEIGYKFTASLDVERAFLESDRPFGTVEEDKLLFQFPVFVKFSPSPSLTTESGGSITLASYKAEVSIDNAGQLKCVLTEIPKLDKNYEGFTFRDIGLASPPEDTELQKQYTITLKEVQK